MSMRNTTVTPPKPASNSAPAGFGAPSPGPLAPLPGNSGKPAPINRGRGQLIRLDTLGGQFNTLVLISVILATLALIASFWVLSSLNQSFSDIVKNSAPSISAAQKLGEAIQDADAKAADYQLTTRIDVTSPDFRPEVYGDNGLRNQAWKTFLSRRQEVSSALFNARTNVTYPGEAEALDIISDRFLDYVARINIMRYELDQGHREAALAAYKSAHDLLVGNVGNVPLDDKGRSPEEQLKLRSWDKEKFDVKAQYKGIEANVQKLTEINKRELDKSANATSTSLGVNTLIIGVLCVLLVAMLGFICFRYATITHRIINPGFGLAFIGAVALTIALMTNLLQGSSDYKNISASSFASVDAATRARQLAADANADESRLLISPETPGLDSTSPALTADVRNAFRSENLKDSFDKKINLMKEQIGLAWGNITFPDERNQLCKVTQNPSGKGGACPSGSTYGLDNYLVVDKNIRDNFTKSLLAEAINLNVGKSNEAFDAYDGALAKLSQINEDEFDRSSCKAVGLAQFKASSCSQVGYIPFWQVGVLVLFPLIALATIGGFWYIRREF